MKPAGRVGDIAFCPSDSHGCPACPHPVQGPAIQGSPNVLINDLPALRVGDPGIHAACCGGNKWKAKEGARSVLINNLPAHRMQDHTEHCGGTGTLVSGSGDVIMGNVKPKTSERKDTTFLTVQLLSPRGVELAGERIEIVFTGGHRCFGITEQNGTFRVDNVPDEPYEVIVLTARLATRS